MHSSLYEKVRAGVLEMDEYFSQRPDSIGIMGASTDQKVTAALRQLAFGCPADTTADLVRVSDSLAHESLLRFLSCCTKELWAGVFEPPDKDDLREIELYYASLGLPGCIGCAEVASWSWDCCPVGWQGQHTGKDKRPCNWLEEVCDDFFAYLACQLWSPPKRYYYKQSVEILHGCPCWEMA
jgi:Plant transposon protein